MSEIHKEVTIEKKSTLMNVLSIVGFIIIVGIGIWGAINAVRLAPSLFSTIGNPFASASTKLTLKLPTSPVQSGTPFAITWTHTPKGGIYAFSYACKDGFAFQTAATSTGGFSDIKCQTAYTIPVTQKSLTLLGVSTKNHFMDVPFAVAYVGADGKKAAEASASLTFENITIAQSPNTTGSVATTTTAKPATTVTPVVKPTTTTPAKPVVTTPTTPTKTRSNPNGTADLAVRILSITGNTSYSNGSQYGAYVDPSQLVSVKFEVKNIGDKATPSWTFNAALPTNPPQPFYSKVQAPLYPGDRVEYTLTFDHIIPGAFMVTVDPTQQVYEASESNNVVSYPIEVNSYQPVPQPQPYYPTVYDNGYGTY
jgi:hypothetical protein